MAASKRPAAAPRLDDPLYDAFRRTDQYAQPGTWEMKPQTPLEYIRLGLAALLILPFKLLGIFLLILLAWLSCRLSFLYPAAYRPAIVRALVRACVRVCLCCIGFFNIRWVKFTEDRPGNARKQTNGSAKAPPVRAAGIISNHCGYLDILLMMSHYFPSFVARDATRDMPFIGIISQEMGCVYVDREQKNTEYVGVSARVKQRMQELAAGTAKGVGPMLLFPEGTTTNGRHLLPFKTGAFLAGAPVQPVLLKYSQNRVQVSWESIEAPLHIFLLLCEPLHSVVCTELPVYVPSEAERRDPVLYAANVRQYMLDHSDLIPSRATYDDKRVFHALLKGQPPPALPPSKKLQ